MLVIKRKCVYENLLEHVCDPNGERSPRDVYDCGMGCERSKDGYWDVDGGQYGGITDYKMRHKYSNTWLEWKIWTSAIGSYERQHDKLEYRLMMRKKLKLVNIMNFYYEVKSCINGFLKQFNKKETV
jgi:hypothetical protein